MRLLAWTSYGSIYRTTPFDGVLKGSFDANRLLFGGESTTETSMKVAVTTTTYVDQRTVVLSNYNRPEYRSGGFHSISQRLVMFCAQVLLTRDIS